VDESLIKQQDLTTRRCVPCEGGVAPLDTKSVSLWLHSVPGWTALENPPTLERVFEFTEYARALSFANAVAWVAIRENHHPVIELHYSRCVVRYYTHSVSGLTENDFICAAKISALCAD
jgi:4a-hydroxytetrahydrobiopterin dehydratase